MLSLKLSRKNPPEIPDAPRDPSPTQTPDEVPEIPPDKLPPQTPDEIVPVKEPKTNY